MKFPSKCFLRCFGSLIAATAIAGIAAAGSLAEQGFASGNALIGFISLFAGVVVAVLGLVIFMPVDSFQGW